MRRYIFNTEVNYCKACDREFRFPEVCHDWKCPVCGETLLLKVDIGGHYYSCLIRRPQELKIGEQVTLDNNFIHEILDIKENNGIFRIALKEYTAVTFESDDQIATITGSWYD